MCLVQTKVTAGLAGGGNQKVSDDVFAGTEVPLVGFSANEASDLDELIQLVAWARAPIEFESGL